MPSIIHGFRYTQRQFTFRELTYIKGNKRMTSYDSTLGAFVIGGLISSALFGLFTCQVYIYFKNFPLESKWVRHGLVNGMWLIELVHTICTSHVVYFYAVTHFGDGETLSTRVPLSIPISLLCHGIVTMLVQSYYAYRIARFADNNHPYIIPAICTILTFCTLVSDVAVVATETASLYTGKSSIATFFVKMEWLVIIPLVLRNVVDVIISATMVYHLRKQRSMSAYKNTIAVVDKLILWAIETGVVTCILGITLLIHFLTDRSNYGWITLIMVIPKIFSNAMLANMNSRIGLRQLQSTVLVIGSEFGPRMANMNDDAVTRSIQFNEMQSTTTFNSNATHPRKNTIVPRQ